MLGHLVESIRLCLEGEVALRSPDKRIRKQARKRSHARAKGVPLHKLRRAGKGSQDALAVRKRASDKEGWGHPARFPLDDFESVAEEIRSALTK